MKTIAIMLGGREFLVRQLTIKADATWRAMVRPIVEPVAELAIASSTSHPTVEAITRLAFASSLFVDPAATLDAVLAYSADLAGEREWIEENAYSDEALRALLALFFGMSPLTPTGTAQRPAETISKNS